MYSKIIFVVKTKKCDIILTLNMLVLLCIKLQNFCV